MIEWSDDTVETLISEYRERKCVWNPTNSFYKLHSKKNGAWEEIGKLCLRAIGSQGKNAVTFVVIHSFANDKTRREKNCSGYRRNMKVNITLHLRSQRWRQRRLWPDANICCSVDESPNNEETFWKDRAFMFFRFRSFA
jgi:hypothetical protein